MSVPNGWTEDTKDETYNPNYVVFFENPQSCLFSVRIFKKSAGIAVEGLLTDQTDALRKKFSGPTSVEFTKWSTYDGKGVEIEGTVTKILRSRARLFAFENADYACIITEYATLGDFEKYAADFEEIRQTFKLNAISISIHPILAPADGGVSFKDDPLGMSLADFCAKYDRKVGNDPCRAPMLEFGKVDFTKMPGKLDFDNMPELPPPTSYRESAKVIAKKNFPYEKMEGKTPGYPETIAGVSAEATYEFFAESISDWDLLANRQKEILGFRFRKVGEREQPPWVETPPEILAAASRLHLGSITVSFPIGDFDLVVSALKTKYGPPSYDKNGTLQDDTGTKLSSRQVRWVIGQDQINAAELPTANYAQVGFFRQAVIDRAKAKIGDPSKDL